MRVYMDEKHQAVKFSFFQSLEPMVSARLRCLQMMILHQNPWMKSSRARWETTTFSLAFHRLTATNIAFLKILGSFSNDDGDGTKNVTIKTNSHFSKIVAIILTCFICQMQGKFLGVEFLETTPKLRRERKISRRVFTSSKNVPSGNFTS